jgi:4a-hydroxytetrahydrobiopterin dehydratase
MYGWYRARTIPPDTRIVQKWTDIQFRRLYDWRMATKLSESEIRSALRDLSGWTLVDGKLHREYKFADLIHAFGFMASGALVAEAMGHHPGWCNVYDRLTVDLTTHDAGGVSAKDVELAGKLDGLYPKGVAGAKK